MLLIVQPFFKATGSGVCDHSLALREGLRARGIEARIHSLRGEDGLPTREPLPAATTWLVQVSIYGYQKRGLPLGLLKLLAEARRSGIRLIVLFHETWVHHAPLTSSARWLAGLQRQLCRRIALLADEAVFNTPYAWQWGQGLLGERAHYIPSFSNVGEPVALPAFEARARRFVVFGGAAAKLGVYRELGPLLARLLRQGDLSEVADIGTPVLAQTAFAPADRRLVVEHGHLAPDAVSRLLLDSRYGGFDTPWGAAAKSGVFAAYAAHGVLPVSTWREAWVHPCVAGLYPAPGEHFIAGGALAALCGAAGAGAGAGAGEPQAARLAQQTHAAYVPSSNLLQRLAGWHAGFAEPGQQARR